MKKSELYSKLKDHLGLKNVNEVPKIDKVVVAMGIGSLVTRKGHKDFEEFERNMRQITGQKPVIVHSKKSISNFKLREGMPVMLRVTLRGQRAYDFLERLNKLVFPRIRDFSWISKRKFDQGGNLSIGIKNYNVFPELGLDDVSIPMGLQITVVPTTANKNDSQKLLEEIWFIFQ